MLSGKVEFDIWFVVFGVMRDMCCCIGDRYGMVVDSLGNELRIDCVWGEMVFVKRVFWYISCVWGEVFVCDLVLDFWFRFVKK